VTLSISGLITTGNVFTMDVVLFITFRRVAASRVFTSRVRRNETLSHSHVADHSGPLALKLSASEIDQQ
jgi:hypothetical protein